MYKQKLIDLLKSDEKTKTAMEKLEFGCLIKHNKYGIVKIYNQSYFLNEKGEDGNFLYHLYSSGSFEIIGLPLQERSIRMYCKNKGLLTMYKNELQFNYANISIELDDTKDFDNQSEEVYQKIYEALLELNK